MAAAPSMVVITDNDVPDAVATFLKERGHQVQLHREVFPLRTPDPVIARRADQLGLVIVTWNCSHLKRLLLRHKTDHGTGHKLQDELLYPSASLLAFACQHVDGRRRIEEFIHLVEAEFIHVCQGLAPRFVIEIGPTYFRLQR